MKSPILFLVTALFSVSIVPAFGQKKKTCFPGTFRDGLDCSVCPPGTYTFKANQLACVPCPAGTFRRTEGAQSEDQCIGCPAGTFAAKEGSTSCKSCPAGQASLLRSASCSACPPGSALSRFSNSGCEKCEEGFFSTESGSEACTRCPDGTFTASEKGATKCDLCPPGTSRKNTDRIRNSCEECQAGTFTDKAGAEVCKLCPPGTVPNRDRTGCKKCPSGTFSNRIPSTTCRSCTGAATTVGQGAAGCKDPEKGCPFDTFENKDGICQACLAGERLDKTKMECVACGPNEVSSGGADSECKKCEAPLVPFGPLTVEEKSACRCKEGFIFDGKECVACPAGSFWADESFRSDSSRDRQGSDVDGVCALCPIGTFSDKPGSLECKRCPVNMFQDRPGGTACFSCPPGSMSPVLLIRFSRDANQDRSKCIEEESGCESGQIRTKKGKCKVVSCYSPNTIFSKRSCIQCSTVRRSNGKKCVKCSRTETSAGGGATECEKCPIGKRQGFRGGGGRFVPKLGGKRFRPSTCNCPRPRVEFDGGCVKVCPLGTGLEFVQSTDVVGSLVRKCVTCPSRTVGRGDSLNCFRCSDSSIAVGNQCVKCPNGEVVADNIFGRKIDSCRTE